jgi:hypothetical protein
MSTPSKAIFPALTLRHSHRLLDRRNHNILANLCGKIHIRTQSPNQYPYLEDKNNIAPAIPKQAQVATLSFQFLFLIDKPRLSKSSAEVCFTGVRFAEVCPLEIYIKWVCIHFYPKKYYFDEVCPSEVCPTDVCSAEVWRNFNIFLSPLIPYLNSLQKFFQMFFISHSLNSRLSMTKLPFNKHRRKNAAKHYNQ